MKKNCQVMGFMQLSILNLLKKDTHLDFGGNYFQLGDTQVINIFIPESQTKFH